MFPNLVIYHEFRDFGHGLRDKILLSWQVTSPWFLEIPRKMGKTHYFSQKYQNFSHFFKKIRDFSAILRFIARDYSDFLGVFLLVIFVNFFPWSRDFQEKSFGNTAKSEKEALILHHFFVLKRPLICNVTEIHWHLLMIGFPPILWRKFHLVPNFEVVF